MRPLLAALGFALTLIAAAPALAEQPASAGVTVKDFDVFVDPPTGFVFVKLPQGWKFAGKVEQTDALPPGVLTSLLPPDADDATRMARVKREVAPRGEKS